MNSSKYIITSSSDKKFWGWCSNLGHELFFTRKIVLILLLNNLINENYIIVTAYEDRKCLYSSIFNNVITYDTFMTLNETNVINLCPYLLSLYAAEQHFLDNIGAPNGKTMQCLKNLGLDEVMLCENDIFKNCNTELLNNLCCKIDFIDLTLYENIIKSDFFIIHIRYGSKYLEYIYNIIDTFNINCIIFTQSTNISNKYNIVSDLQIYASLLNHVNCKFFISEWSGGGQLSQFCHNKKILYYYDNYPADYNNNEESLYRENNNKNFYAYWDHYTPINCKRIFLKKEDFENIDILQQICFE